MNREDVISEIGNFNEDFTVLAYFYDKVCVGILKNNKLYFNNEVNNDFLTQIRLFNNDKEIRYILEETTNKFQKTIISDSESKIFIDEDMFISGNREVSRNEQFVTIKQDGGNIDIPIYESFNITKEDLSTGLRLKVRNYYREDENNQLVFTNSRIVKIRKEEV